MQPESQDHKLKSHFPITGDTHSPFARQISLWMRGLAHEIAFWTHWFQTKGDTHPDEFTESLRKDRPLPSYLLPIVSMCNQMPVRILDVGCGPLSALGTGHPDQLIELTAVDPLAEVYGSLIKRSRLDPPAWPRVAFAEDLSAFVNSDSFDIVYCRNALDHSFDPIRGLWEMVEVLRVGGTAVLLHLPNEAEHANYIGLHQWNFDIQTGSFIVWNKTARHNVNDLLGSFCTVTAETLDGYVLVHIRKNEPLELATERYKNDRVRDLLLSFLAVALEVSQVPVSVRQPFSERLRRYVGRLIHPAGAI